MQRTLGYLQPLLDVEHVDVRSYVAERVNSILRVEDEMLVTLALRGVPTDYEPVLHLRRRSQDGLFDRFAYHYESIWTQAASPLITHDADSYPDPDEYPDRYRVRTADGSFNVRSGRSMRSAELHPLNATTTLATPALTAAASITLPRRALTPRGTRSGRTGHPGHRPSVTPPGALRRGAPQGELHGRPPINELQAAHPGDATPVPSAGWRPAIRIPYGRTAPPAGERSHSSALNRGTPSRGG